MKTRHDDFIIPHQRIVLNRCPSQFPGINFLRFARPMALAGLCLAMASPALAAEGPKPAEQATRQANAELLKELPFAAM